MQKPSECLGSTELFTPQGAEDDLKDCYQPNDHRGTNGKHIDTVIVKYETYYKN